MHSPSPSLSSLSHAEQEVLLRLARESILHGLIVECLMKVDTNDYPAHLCQELACFVTLNRNGALRGCIGHLEPIQPLVKDVAENAYAAAFRDPRFPPLTESELKGLEIHISILSPSTQIEFSTEQDLIAKLRPGIDGLILKRGANKGTFLPSVWESLPDAASFLSQLKRKAGLATNFWSDDIIIYRYTTDSFSDKDIDQATA